MLDSPTEFIIDSMCQFIIVVLIKEVFQTILQKKIVEVTNM